MYHPLLVLLSRVEDTLERIVSWKEKVVKFPRIGWESEGQRRSKGAASPVQLDPWAEAHGSDCSSLAPSEPQVDERSGQIGYPPYED